jgi:HK97 gp10 family phage protein
VNSITTNLPDFKRQLRDVSIEMQRKAARNATAAAASVFRAAARRTAAAPKAENIAGPMVYGFRKRKRTGTLARAVYMAYNRRKSSRGTVTFTIGVRAGKGAAKRGTDAYYWRWLEGGWRPRGRKGALKGGNRSRALQRSRSGIAEISYPFIAPAFKQSGASALNAFNKRMALEIKRLQAIR